MKRRPRASTLGVHFYAGQSKVNDCVDSHQSDQSPKRTSPGGVGSGGATTSDAGASGCAGVSVWTGAGSTDGGGGVTLGSTCTTGLAVVVGSGAGAGAGSDSTGGAAGAALWPENAGPSEVPKAKASATDAAVATAGLAKRLFQP